MHDALKYLCGLAAYFEQGNYDKAIEVCEKAVEEGRSVRSMFSSVVSLS
jgi:stress-induced-phosphoprotein 1